MNVQTGTCPHAHRSALILWGVIGVSVKRAISWKKTGKRALKGTMVSEPFIFTVFFLFKANVCLCWGRDGDSWERLHAAASCASVRTAAAMNPALLWFSDHVRENVTNGSDYDRVGSCPTSGGGRFATSSNEFIFHYHILRNDSGVEYPGCVFVLGYFWLICNIVGELVRRYFHSSVKLVYDYSGDSSTADQNELSALTADLSSAWQPYST